MSTIKDELVAELERRVGDKILERTNADLLEKLIRNADSDNEAMMIAELGTTYKRTGLHFDKRLEKMTSDIRYFRKNEKLSFHTDDAKPTHKLIIGDNYEALQNLLIQYKGKVSVIYIDPPYGKDSMGEFAQTNYENAITRDNLLSMLYPRLMLAKQLLSDNGVIFCSIDDKNQAYVKCLFDEVFGEGNFISCVSWLRNYASANDSKRFASVVDYLLVYGKTRNYTRNLLPRTDKQNQLYKYDSLDGKGKWRPDNLSVRTYSANYDYPIINPNTGEAYNPPKGRCWMTNKETVERWINEGRVFFGQDKKGAPQLKRYLNEVQKGVVPTTFWSYEECGHNDEARRELKEIFSNPPFDSPKPIRLLLQILKIASNPDSIILDFFAGSGTTGHAVLDLNEKDGGDRQFILCQLNEKTETTPNGIACDVTSKRLKRVMTGECYDGTKDFDWMKKNKPYGGNLDVYEIASVANFESTEGKTPFDVVDETLYGQDKFKTLREKIEWVCKNFSNTQKTLKE